MAFAVLLGAALCLAAALPAPTGARDALLAVLQSARAPRGLAHGPAPRHSALRAPATRPDPVLAGAPEPEAFPEYTWDDSPDVALPELPPRKLKEKERKRIQDKLEAAHEVFHPEVKDVAAEHLRATVMWFFGDYTSPYFAGWSVKRSPREKAARPEVQEVSPQHCLPTPRGPGGVGCGLFPLGKSDPLMMFGCKAEQLRGTREAQGLRHGVGRGRGGGGEEQHRG